MDTVANIKECKFYHHLKSLIRDCCSKFATGLNVRFTIISSHFFANYMNIFHKTEIQTVILRCCTGLYLNWFKSYDTNAKKRNTAKNAKKTKKTTLHK